MTPLTESNHITSLHQAAAAQSKICELGSLFLTNWSESVARERGQRKKRKITLTRRPGAYLAGMARQCPRGRPGAAEGRLHRDAPGAPHLALPPAKARVAQALEHAQHAQQSPAAKHLISELGGGRSRGGRPPRSPRGGSGRRFHSVELVGGAEASISPKVAMAEATGVGRRGQATAAAIQIAKGIVERERRASRAGLGRLTDPDPSRVGLAEPEWAGWASWPVGQNRLWPII
jgi:hypothetical protein